VTESDIDLFSLNGRVAVITGACGILGQHMAAAFAARGASVVCIDLEEQAATALAADLTARFDVPALGIGCDISDAGAVKAMAVTVRDFGSPTVLINNAATKGDDLGAFLTPTEDYDIEVWRRINAVNLDGAFLVAQAMGKLMIEAKTGGSIIQIASIYGVLGPDNRIYDGSSYNGKPISTPPVYAASKAGIVGLTRYLATTWAEHNIRVNTVTPGGVESGQNPQFVEQYSNRIPLRRMARADELIGPLIFLASDASSYITGQNIMVDGGLSAW